MGNFHTAQRTKAGVIQKGTLFATDRAGAAASLQQKGLTPILVKEQSEKSGQGSLLDKLQSGGSVKLQDKVIFSRQFSTMINAGVPIAKALSILEKQTDSKKLQAAISDIQKQVTGGATLANSMSAHPEVFNQIYINMVKAGENRGYLRSGTG